MPHLRRFALLAVLAIATSAAHAADSSFETRTGHPLPQAGVYFDPQQPGTGLVMDVGLEGTVVAAFGTYDAQGEPVFYTLQGVLRRDNLPAGQPGVVGRVRSPLYRSTGGQCLGCPWQPASIGPATDLPEAELLFTEARRVTLRIGDAQWRMDRFTLNVDPADFVRGRFMLLVDERGTQRHQVVADVELVNANASIDAAPTSPSACAAGPAPAAVQRELRCIGGDCAAFQRWAGGAGAGVFAWQRADSTTWQLARARASGAGLRLADAPQYLLQVDTRRLIASPPPAVCASAGSALRLARDPASRISPYEQRFEFALTAGVYWDPEQPGTGYAVDVAADGRTFGAWYGYTAAGRPTFLTVDGYVARRGLLGVQISFEGDLYQSRNGQCIGCAYRPPQTDRSADFIRLQLLDVPWGVRAGAAVEQLLTRRDYLDIGGTRLIRLEIDRAGATFMQGRYLLRVEDRIYDFARSVLVSETSVLAQVELVEDGSPLRFRAVCTRHCVEYTGWLRGLDALRIAFQATAGGSTFAVATARVPQARGFPLASGERDVALRLDTLDRDHPRSADSSTFALALPGQPDLRRDVRLQLVRNAPDALSDD